MTVLFDMRAQSAVSYHC